MTLTQWDKKEKKGWEQQKGRKKLKFKRWKHEYVRLSLEQMNWQESSWRKK